MDDVEKGPLKLGWAGGDGGMIGAIKVNVGVGDMVGSAI